MPKYKSADIAELAHQLTLSPRRKRLAQIAGAQRLLELVCAEREYPYDFACFHLTGYRPLKPSRRAALKGEHLISDLVRLIEHLSQSASIQLSAINEPVQTQEELSQRLSVSIKTIARWRQRGLSGLRVLDSERVSRLVFTERAVQRFVCANRKLILRGGAFRQLSELERDRIINRARQLVADSRVKLQEAARIISEENGRAVETIRYTLKRFDRANPDQALFGPGGKPRVPDNYAAIYKASRRGVTTAALADEYGLPQKRITRICLEMRAYELLNRKLTAVYHPEFDAVDAEQQILEANEPTADGSNGRTLKPSSDTPAYLKALYRVPLLTQEQERDLFRRYNYCKYQASKRISELEPCSVTARELDDIDRLIEIAEKYQARIIRANLRLVVNIASRHLRRGCNMYELISDGNVSLMRAVERFDYARGFKFSTYASWAIMKNFARTIPEQRYHYVKYVTGQDELLEAAPDATTAAAQPAVEADSVRAALDQGMAQLEQREREILTCHFGLTKDGEPVTLEQLGERFGVTKERIRQIEKRALTKLKRLLSPSIAEHVRAC